tara:strand:+ start:2679 stop:3401 length:723 start_codon:yes stop_codon:yes gene_type:complete
MDLNSRNLKLIIGSAYLILLTVGLYFLFSVIDLKDLTNYDFIRLNRDLIFQYKKENFLFLAVMFFFFCIIWVLFLGFAMPIVIFAGFVFGKWWGFILILFSTTIGATLLYYLVGIFFREIIKEKLIPKFYKLKEIFTKNDTLYFMCFRFIGGGGAPYAVQNVLPIIFDMHVKKYFVATLLGSAPATFVTVALGSGIEKVIDKNEEITVLQIIGSPEIYLPLSGFFTILILAFIIKKNFFK